MINSTLTERRVQSAPVSRWVEDDTVERLILATDVAAIGSLNSPPTSSYFRGEHLTTNYLVGFPRSSLWIRQNRGKAFVADPTVATIYNRGQVFTRAEIAPEGDVGEWFGVAEDVARDAVSHFDPHAAESQEPLRFVSAHICTDLYRRQRGIAMRATKGESSLAELEEAVILLFYDVVASAYCKGDPTSAPTPYRGDIVERAREVIAQTYSRNLGVREIAAMCGASVFHLCRTFRASTGKTLFGYRRDLRLRLALGRVLSRRGDLSRVAIELGFFSHSHFTAAFRREYGMSPTAFAAAHAASAARAAH